MSYNSSHALELRKQRLATPEGRLLKKLESRCGAYYIDYGQQCPLSHTSHRVGSNYKLCSPIDGYKSNGCCQDCSKPRRFRHQVRSSDYHLSRYAQNRRGNPYDPKNYHFTI